MLLFFEIYIYILVNIVTSLDFFFLICHNLWIYTDLLVFHKTCVCVFYLFKLDRTICP